MRLIRILTCCLAAIVLAACKLTDERAMDPDTGAHLFYSAEATLFPDVAQGIYTAEAKVFQHMAADGAENTKLIAAPKVTARLGRDASIVIASQKDKYRIELRAFHPGMSGTPARCSIEITDAGKTIYTTNIQVSALSNPAANLR